MKLLSVILPFFFIGCVGIPKGVKPVENFSLNRYFGKWHEIARLDHSFERGLSRVTANYSLRDDGGVTFNQFCATRGTAPIDRRYFKELITEVIREEFDLGLRNDLHGRNHRQQQGWKGLSARIADPVNRSITRN